MWRTLFCSLTFLLSGLSSAWAKDCPSAHTPEQIKTRLDTAQTALKDLESETFSLAMEELSLMLPCLKSQPTPSLAADLHRMRGIELYIAGEEDASLLALRAAKVLAPSYAFPEALFPEGHAMPDLWAGVSVDEPRHARAPVPRDSQVAFDGALSRDRPSDRATVFQHIDMDGGILHTRYMLPKDPLPSYPSIPRQRHRLVAASVVSGVVAGTSYALGWQGRQRFMAEDPERTRSELTRLRRQVNNRFIVSGVFTTLTSAGVVGAVLVGPR